MDNDEKIIGFVHSDCIRPSALKNGYALVVTNKRILGARKIKFGSIAACFEDNQQIDPQYIQKAYDTLNLVEQKKDFEFFIPEIQQVEIKSADSMHNGFILIRTKNQEKKLTVDWQMDQNILQTLFKLIDNFGGLVEGFNPNTKLLCPWCENKVTINDNFCTKCGKKI